MRFTTADLELMPDDGKRYEIIDGELYVSSSPSWEHQEVSLAIAAALQEWSLRTKLGRTGATPGVIFSDDEAVIPDIVWMSNARLRSTLRTGHIYGTPELVVEILSPGASNERRDRDVKLKLYSRRGVNEYWIVDWPSRAVDVYRRTGEGLDLAAHLAGGDTLTSPLLPGFSVQVSSLFLDPPA